jgi:hypothetical protein
VLSPPYSTPDDFSPDGTVQNYKLAPVQTALYRLVGSRHKSKETFSRFFVKALLGFGLTDESCIISIYSTDSDGNASPRSATTPLTIALIALESSSLSILRP